MSKLTDIEQKIDQMEGGAFQEFCDVYLSKLGYANCQALGKKEGTRKTTKGIPDTFFKTEDGRYIFAMYTAQKGNIVSKAEKDIYDCLDENKTGIKIVDISEILYCHTTSTMEAGEEKHLTDICKKHGVALKFFGINKISLDLYFHYHKIAFDLLGIQLDTNQVFSLSDFITSYNANPMAAPIDSNFLYRENEQKAIKTAIELKDVIILSGSAGVGKTRLAVHYARGFSDAHQGKLYCIHSNGQLVYDDLRDILSSPGNYVFIIDDANHLVGLQHAIRQMTTLGEGYRVKIIVTVRDYARGKVVQDIREVAQYEIINVDKFSDKEISGMLEENLGIRNELYLEKIVRIAEGNARIAMLAGRIARESNRLDSIRDASDLYENYYGGYLQTQNALSDIQLCRSAGIIAFLETLNLDHLEPLMPILDYCKLDREAFISFISKLHELEMVDIYSDKVARFSDQCLANYLVKYIFVDKRLIPLVDMLENCFFSFRQRTIRSIGMLLNVYASEEMAKLIAKDICSVWDNLKSKNHPQFWHIVKTFFSFKPIDTLILLKDRIDHQNSIVFDATKMSFQSVEKDNRVEDEVLEILGKFAYLEQLPTAIDMFFLYFSKRPDLFSQFCHIATSGWGIDHITDRYAFYTQIQLGEKLKEKIEKANENNLNILAVHIARGLLKLLFEAAEEGRGHTVVIRSIKLKASEGVKVYRKLLWESLLILCRDINYKHLVKDILLSYAQECREAPDQELVFYDMEYIQQCFHEYFSPDDLMNCIAVAHIIKRCKRWGWDFSDRFYSYMCHDNMKVYLLFTDEDDMCELGYEEREKRKQERIVEYAKHSSLYDIEKLICFCSDYKGEDHSEQWELSQGLLLVFQSLSERKELLFECIKSYLQHGTPLLIYPHDLVRSLFSASVYEDEVYRLISAADEPGRNVWLFAYFCELPTGMINRDHIDKLYSFLAEADEVITSSPNRRLDFLEKYKGFDSDVFIKACRILYLKKDCSPFMFHVYFNLLFNKHAISSQVVIDRFKDNFDLLAEIYMSLRNIDPHTDYDGDFFQKIFLVYPRLLEMFILDMINQKHMRHHIEEQPIMRLWELENYMEIMDVISASILKNGNDGSRFYLKYYYRSFLQQTENDFLIETRQNEWIKHHIDTFSLNSVAMYSLFTAISNYTDDRRRECILHFTKSNQDPGMFHTIPLIEMEGSYSGSIIPYYEQRIAFLKTLLPYLCGLEYLMHSKRVSDEILLLEAQIKRAEIEEILEDM